MTLTTEEKATNFETISHIQMVQKHIFVLIALLLERARLHDESKLQAPELEYFTRHTHELAGLSYGTQEYADNLANIKPALAHHYANNRHHPEHFKNGVEDMNLVDLMEMVCDWKASAARQEDGNVRIGLARNAQRFNLSPQLVRIIENTIELLER